MPCFEIIVVGPPDFVSDEVKRAWFSAGVTLLGPVSCMDVSDEIARRAGGVLLDIGLDSVELFGLSERLMTFDVPFLFVVNSRTAVGSSQPYFLTAVEDDIKAAISALAQEGSDKDQDRSFH